MKSAPRPLKLRNGFNVSTLVSTRLDLVQQDATRPLRELGDRVGLSPSAVQRRLTQLRRAGVIRAEVAVVDPRAVGVSFTAVVLVALVDDKPARHKEFRASMVAEPCVQQCFSIVGQWDYVVILVTTDLAANREVSQRLFAEVSRYETLPAATAVKAGLTVPVGGPQAGR
ncbi:Lrp/AsnC family transcriptional regulator [Kibdelosporangium philippinense]|uniref:Lrp/AsnC family transcriptional regulator n=1 Tax=Kibdelosporangium philippinense TaxID=211113 RepID=A0ABS8Z8Z6_9PSEU|nr:Lrp/AsnC family transcriptional regulator [Kibdelosporangium philippinense]MCE7004280.1 Lrp/AsnC family transcriptional regulator [Kibdelosporangium philippinense]